MFSLTVIEKRALNISISNNKQTLVKELMYHQQNI